jgi:hypothetical protein
MNYKYFVTLLSGITLLAISCKKDSPPTEPVILQVIAPCPINETQFDIDSVYFGPSIQFPEAKYRVRFIDTAANGTESYYIEYAFNKIPTSGKYNFVLNIDTNNLNNLNQIAFVRDSGSFVWRSGYTENNDIYIENNNQELIISYCTLSDTSIFFDPINCMCYTGNRPSKFKIRKQY